MAVSRVFDADGHVSEPPNIWLTYLDESLREKITSYPGYEHGNISGIDADGPERPFSQGFVPSTSRPEIHQRTLDPSDRLQVMDEEGIEYSALFPTRALRLGGIRDPELAPGLFRAYNNWLADFCSRDSERLIGVAMVPMQQPENAVVEAKRAVLELGHRGLFITPNPVDGRNLDDPVYERLWDLAEELNVPALLHVSMGIRLPMAGAERFDRYCLVHLHAHPMELMIAAASLILGGVLERHPGLRVAFLEAGCGWVPYWLERMDEHAEHYRFDVPYLKAKPSEYFRRQCFVSFELEEQSLPYVAEVVGSDRLVFAADFPHHDCIFPGAVKAVRERDDLGPELVNAVLSENPQRLYFGN